MSSHRYSHLSQSSTSPTGGYPSRNSHNEPQQHQHSRPKCVYCRKELYDKEREYGACRSCQTRSAYHIATPSPTPGPFGNVYGGFQQPQGSPPQSIYGGSTHSTRITAFTTGAQYAPTESTIRQSQNHPSNSRRTPYYQGPPAPPIASGPARYVDGMGTPPPDPEHDRMMLDSQYALRHTGYAGESYGSDTLVLRPDDMSEFDRMPISSGSGGSAHGFAMYRDSSPMDGYLRDRSYAPGSVASGGSHGRHDGRPLIPLSSNGQYDIRPVGPPSNNGRTRSGHIYRHGSSGVYPSGRR